MELRAFGFVEEAGKIDNLRKVVELFQLGSPTNINLKENIIPQIVSVDDGRERFISLLDTNPTRIMYKDLVGTAFKPRGSARCNGIIQAVIEGQSRPFSSDWVAGSYLKWAVALGFIEYDYTSDSFKITPLGEKYTISVKNSNEEKEILAYAFLSYPLVVRILRLLSDGNVKTKFELGSQLGFQEEPGFTNFPQDIFIKSLVQASTSKEKSEIRQNWEGTSDKYARMICSWIMDKRLAWVEQIKKNKINITVGSQTFSANIAQSYQITGEGLKALRRADGKNIQQKISRIVHWGMLSTKSKNIAYTRTRRALLLQLMNSPKKLNVLQVKLKEKGFDENIQTIEDDIEGLINIGINVTKESDNYYLSDNIIGLVIPELSSEEKEKDDIDILIDNTRAKLKHIPHEYLILIDQSFKKESSLMFEIKTIELLTKEGGFEGEHLGGTDKPDGIIYTKELEDNYGVIIDNKAYSDGFNIPASERDKMTRYVHENRIRPNSHTTKWWEKFPTELLNFYFLFISSKFYGSYRNQILRIISAEDTKGGAISASELLLTVDKLKGGLITKNNFKDELFVN